MSTSSETTNSIALPPERIPGRVISSSEEQSGDSKQQHALVKDQPTPPEAIAMLEPEKESAAEQRLSSSMPMPAARPMEVPADEAASLETDGRMRVYRQRFRDAKPINFGKYSPRQYQVHGVDVSRWQGEIDWVKLRSQGANFAYIKATDGGDHLDPMFRKNWRRASQSGIKHGAYHFFYWCRTAGEQADWFIRNVPRDPKALPPVIDVEWNGDSACKRRLSPARVREKMQVFMDKLEAHYGKRPIIYTAPDFYEDNLQGAFKEYSFWLRAVARHPSKVYPGRKWVFWQYSGSGLSHGVQGRIDLNAFRGSEADWHDWVAER